MIKPIDILFVSFVMLSGAVTYVIKYSSEIKHNDIAQLHHKITAQKEAIDILNADWALLTSPSHLQTLIKNFSDELHLVNVQPEQFTSQEKIKGLAMNPEATSAKIRSTENVGPDVSLETTGTIKQDN